MFIREWLYNPQVKIIRLAKELVKFNERCFVRLLGDMRSCNFVMDMTPDVEEVQIRIRPMDFDQQSYQGNKKFYLPQFFRENTELVLYCIHHLDPTTALQYQREEQFLILRRMKTSKERLRMLLQAMSGDCISPPEKVSQLREELAEHFGDDRYLDLDSMGELVHHNLERLTRQVA